MDTDREKTATDENAADTGLAFSIGQGTSTGTGPGAGTGSLDGTAETTDFGPGIEFTDDPNDDRLDKTQEHDLGGHLADRARKPEREAVDER